MILDALKTILVIEDDHDTRVSVRQELEASGYFVFSAANGQQGLETLKRIKPPCLVLLDMVMPVMDGEGFIEALEADPAFNSIPIVLVTAYPDKSKHRAAKSLVRKPIDLPTLLSVVQQHCAHD